MSTTEPPAILSKPKVEARVLRQKVWDRCNRDNLHFMGVLVGREGSGKSYTALSIAQMVDPTFHAGRVMFDPGAFLERLKEWKADGETKGKAIVIDEAGVGVGVRSWYEKDQIKFNQVLQVIRDENMAVFFTLPRLKELDSMSRGRLHALLEMVDKEDGEYATIKWKNVDPDRTNDSGKVYKKYPRLRVGGAVRRVKKMRIGPPGNTLATNYEGRKDAFQSDLYDAALKQMDDDADENELTAKELAVKIADSELDRVVSVNNKTGEPYINRDLIRAEFETTVADARTVKSLLERRYDADDLEDYV